jgi:hypothetical protein
VNQQDNRRELFAPARRATAEDVENSSPDSGDGSVKLMGAHFERNYEMPLHTKTPDIQTRHL